MYPMPEKLREEKKNTEERVLVIELTNGSRVWTDYESLEDLPKPIPDEFGNPWVVISKYESDKRIRINCNAIAAYDEIEIKIQDLPW